MILEVSSNLMILILIPCSKPEFVQPVANLNLNKYSTEHSTIAASEEVLVQIQELHSINELALINLKILPSLILT